MATRAIASAAVVIAASCWIIAGSPAHMASFREHVKRVQGLPCRDPRLSVVELDELMPAGEGGGRQSDETWLPERTVLHRCDRGCGYCSGRNVCGPAAVEKVTLAFQVRHHVASNMRPHLQLVEAENHTKCGCVPDHDRPR